MIKIESKNGKNVVYFEAEGIKQTPCEWSNCNIGLDCDVCKADNVPEMTVSDALKWWENKVKELNTGAEW